MRGKGIWVCALVASALIVGCTDQGTQITDPIDGPLFAMGGSSGPSVNGQATLPLEELGGRQTVSFHAREAKDGSVSGSMQTKSRGQDMEGHVSLDCMVINGTEAILGGVVTQARLGPDNTFPLQVGWRVWFKVRDNGEGNNNPPDEFTDWYAWFPEELTITHCKPYPIEEFPDWIPDLVAIEVGNIQVRP
jgi:hypothetical protein